MQIQWIKIYFIKYIIYTGSVHRKLNLLVRSDLFKAPGNTMSPREPVPQVHYVIKICNLIFENAY